MSFPWLREEDLAGFHAYCCGLPVWSSSTSCVSEQEGVAQQRQGVWESFIIQQLHRLSSGLTLSQQGTPTPQNHPTVSAGGSMVVVGTGCSCLVSVCFNGTPVNTKTDGPLKLSDFTDAWTKLVLCQDTLIYFNSEHIFFPKNGIGMALFTTQTRSKLLICP